MSISDLLNPEDFVEPAAADAIASVETALNCRFPPDYVEFLRLTDGYDGFVGEHEHYLAAWDVGAIADMNEGYEGVDALGLVLVGTNGGGTAYGFTREAPVRWVSVPFVPMEAAEVRVLGETVEGWLGAIAAGDGW